MKPTQQEIIELAREAGFGIGQGISAIRINGYADDLLRLAELLLERFGAGGGEPVAFMVETESAAMTWPAKDYDEALTYCAFGELPIKLYTHPSPTDLRAEYERGLDDAKKACESWANQHSSASGGCTHVDCDFMAAALDCAEAIEALKGKQ